MSVKICRESHTYYVAEVGVLVHNSIGMPNGYSAGASGSEVTPGSGGTDGISSVINENGTKEVEVNGKTVTTNNNTFDPNLVDSQGRTNVERMEQGLAPIDTDGKSVNIHHIDQTNNGLVIEMTATNHQQNYSNLHTNTGQSPSQINRNVYWKWRSQNIN